MMIVDMTHPHSSRYPFKHNESITLPERSGGENIYVFEIFA